MVAYLKDVDNDGGIVLGENTQWVVAGIEQYELFFKNVGILIQGSRAVIYLEGVAIASDARRFLEQHSIETAVKVRPGTVWPKPSIFHLPATPEVLEGLADLSQTHKTSEIADHCHFYVDKEMILQWFDACDSDCPIGVSPTISEHVVRKFCERTGASFREFRNK